MITLDDVMKGSLRERAHHNGGEAFFAYTMQHIQYPRLTRYDRYDKKTKQVVSTWAVDGEDAVSIESAVERLNVPAVFTKAELDELSKVTDEYLDIRHTRDRDLNHALEAKGAIEWRAGKCRLTDTGRAAKESAEARHD